MQSDRLAVDVPEVNHLASSTIKVGPYPHRLEGTYRNRPAQFAAWVGCVAAVPLVVAAMTLSHGAATLGVLGALLLGALAGAVVIGQRGVRPRLEVTREGIVIVNPDQTRSLTWAQIQAFECRDAVVVLTDRNEQVVVSALPTRAWGEPVSALADRLNTRLAEARG
jgi:hypothetical protein